MADFRIEVVVAPSQAVAGAARVEASMLSLEQRANRTRDSIAAAFRPQTSNIGGFGSGFIASATKASTAAEHFSSVVLDASRKARGSIDDAAMSWDGWESKASKAASTGSLASKALAAAPYIAAAAAVASLADTYTNLQNRLAGVTGSASEAKDVSETLFDVAQRTRMEWSAVTEVFVRTTGALKGMGYSQSEVIEFTETLSKAVKVSGASATEANAAMLQLSQGLASGTLRGDELRSVLEQLPTVADVIADSLGVTRGELRKMGEEGKISTGDIIKAFQNAKGEIDGQFAKTVPTIGEQFTKLKNIVVKAVGDMMPLLGPLIENLGRLISVIGEALGYLGNLAGVIAETGREIGSALGLIDTSLPSSELRKMAVEVQGLDTLGIDAAETLIYLADQQDALTESISAGAAAGDRWSMAIYDATHQVLLYGQALEVLRTHQEEARHAGELLQESMTTAKLGLFEALRIKTAIVVKELKEYKRSSGEAARALEQLLDRVRGYRDEVDSVGAAQRELGRVQRDLNRAVDEGNISQEQANDIYARKEFLMRDQIDPLRAVLAGLRDETEAYQLSTDEREISLQFYAIENDLRRKGRDLIDEETAAIRRWLTARQEARQNEQARGESADELLGFGRDVLKANGEGDAARKVKEAEDAKKAAEEAKKGFQDFGTQVEVGLDAVKAQILDTSTLMTSAFVGAFSSMEDAVVSFVTTGKVDFRSMVNSMLADVTKLLLRMALIKAIGGLFPGGDFGGAASKIPFFATGGSFNVGGSGGTDSQLVMFRASPGERVDVRTPAQQNAASGPIVMPAPQVTNQIVLDSKTMVQAMNTPDGVRAIKEVIRLNPSAFRASLR